MIEPVLPMIVASLTLLIMAGLAGYAILVTPFLGRGVVGRMFSGLPLAGTLGMGCLSGLALLHYSLEARKATAIADCFDLAYRLGDKTAKTHCRDEPTGQIRRMHSELENRAENG